MTNASEAYSTRLGLESATPVELETTRARRLNHLQALEGREYLHLREAAAEFARPVMLYPSGRTPRSCCAWRKKLLSGKIPFPLLHVEPSYKFPG